MWMFKIGARHLNVPWRDDFAQTKTDDEISLDVIIREDLE